MGTNHSVSRRNFLQNTSAGMSMGWMASAGLEAASEGVPAVSTSSHRHSVWIATLTMAQLEAGTMEEMVGKVLHRMEQTLACQPDLICLPETFPFHNVERSLPMKEAAESVPGMIVNRFAEFAKEHRCYVICPLNTKDGDRFYNSAVVIDREGKVIGAYHKIHPTVDEIESGVTPGPLQPPVFQTDFGMIGIQICFDINWPEGWRALRKAGAEIIFWPSEIGRAHV